MRPSLLRGTFRGSLYLFSHCHFLKTKIKKRFRNRWFIFRSGEPLGKSILVLAKRFFENEMIQKLHLRRYIVSICFIKCFSLKNTLQNFKILANWREKLFVETNAMLPKPGSRNLPWVPRGTFSSLWGTFLRILECLYTDLGRWVYEENRNPAPKPLGIRCVSLILFLRDPFYT